MKRSKILLMFLCVFSMFLFKINIKAASSLSCSSEVVDKNIICDIKTDETVYITSSLNIVSVSGENNSYSGKKATFTSDGVINFKPTSKGEYKIKIVNADESFTNTETVIVSEKKVSSTTIITTTKKKSSNNLLDKILVNNEEIENFSSNKTKYYLTVENDVESILIDAVASDELSIIDIDGPKKLLVGDNEYVINVTAEDDSIKAYKIIVTKKEKEIEKSNDTDIKNITVENYNLKFDKYSKTFYLKIKKNDNKLKISVDTSSKLAKYEITGNEKLKDGSIIKINVIAEDGSTDMYRIIIKKDSKNILPIFLVMGICILLVIIIIILVKKNKKENKNSIEKKDDSNNTSTKEYNDKTIKVSSVKEDEKEDNGVLVDNDGAEETKMFSYVDNISKEQDISKIIDDELEKTITFDDEF